MFLRLTERDLASREAVGLTWQEYAGAAIPVRTELVDSGFICVSRWAVWIMCALFQVPGGGSWIEISPAHCAAASTFAGHRKGELLMEAEEAGGTA